MWNNKLKKLYTFQKSINAKFPVLRVTSHTLHTVFNIVAFFGVLSNHDKILREDSLPPTYYDVTAVLFISAFQTRNKEEMKQGKRLKQV